MLVQAAPAPMAPTQDHPPLTPAQRPSPDIAAGAGLVGGTVPEQVIDELVTRLAVEEAAASAGRMNGLTGLTRAPARRAALAIGGVAVGLTVVLACMWLLGLVLSG